MSKKYDKENTTGLYLKLNVKTDSDIINYLNRLNKQGFIKELIRREMRYNYDHIGKKYIKKINVCTFLSC